MPRPETEVVVERCLALLDGIDGPRILDVGTGTGAIALALKHERPDARRRRDRRLADALELARENAEPQRPRRRPPPTATCSPGSRGPFELVVSNPPYVDAGEIDALEPEVRDWEPRARSSTTGRRRA